MLNEVIVARPQSGDWLRFREPLAVVVAYRVADVLPCLIEVEHRATAHGHYAAGYVGYEAAPAFDAALSTKLPGKLPLLCFGLYARPEVVASLRCEGSAPAVRWHNPTSEEDYRRALADIKGQIGAGNVYQVNHTLRLRAPAVPQREMFAHFAAGAPYAAFVDADDFAIMSASPELFFDLNGEALVSRPMKGTAARGVTLERDVECQQWLAGSEKNRAENLMITDMVRNDLGKIARVGSVQANDLFRVEKYPTVWQMTSTVVAETKASVADIFQAMFPGASITGAPKRASMARIVDLEDSPREVYTGSIGYLAPGRRAQFNIAIRTAWVDKAAREMRYGVGGGIVWDSDPAEELEEIAAKSRVLQRTRAEHEFELLETMRWTPPQGLYNLSWHMRRLQDSATYFDFELRIEIVERVIADALRDLAPVCHRVRLRVSRDGAAVVQCEPLLFSSGEQALVLAREPIEPDDPFLYHKTTHREVYKAATSHLLPHQEVLLFNALGFVTETNIANVVYKSGGTLFTPPVSDGLLPGTMRARLLAEGKVRERQLPVAQLHQVTDIYLVNSLRGWRKGALTQAEVE
jgi:para-aminobenzoate synthetase/4-amino-4-deoxychorismate lyase